MLDINNKKVCEKLLKGNIGLEKESLRITHDGFFSKTPHPFPGNNNIVRDFCENQTEINTSVTSSAKEALEELSLHTKTILETLRNLPEPEYLWPFSNPPYISKESDISIARYEGEEKEKEIYREYLAERYGRYKMTFSGIHFNYSFSEELLKADFEEKKRSINQGSNKDKNADSDGLGSKSELSDFQTYKNQFYVSLAGKAQVYNWIIVAITAASPLLDSSYVEKGILGKDIFNGMGSTRCSELGYWNLFTLVLDYRDIEHYVDSIMAYIDLGLIHSSAELYYPVRLKPVGKYSPEKLRTDGVGHIELRMIDLNPLTPWGIDLRDVYFIQLFLIYLAFLPDIEVGVREQSFAIQNTKNAAHYDLKTVNVITPDNRTLWVADAACEFLYEMKKFYEGLEDYEGEAQKENGLKISEVIDFQISKFENAENRYAWKIRRQFGGGFVEKGLRLCKEREG
ncbi:MAG: hypothetical protein IJ054_00055 [Lachnospiraceae bacterium]|nr:hypothetical protein [Lachnospiraceae bacterium]